MAWDEDLDNAGIAYKVAAATDNRIRVIAGPGTGKSYAMKRRVARLLEQGVKPEKILAVTFTRVAAEDLHRDRNHEREVDLVMAPAAHAGLYQWSENAIHRFAIGDPQRVRHELFAELRIGMVDGETVRREPYPRGGAALVWPVAAIAVGIASSGAVFMSGFPGRRAERARFGHAQAIVRRGEPVQFQLWVRVFEPQSRPTRPLLGSDGRSRDCGMVKK